MSDYFYSATCDYHDGIKYYSHGIVISDSGPEALQLALDDAYFDFTDNYSLLIRKSDINITSLNFV